MRQLVPHLQTLAVMWADHAGQRVQVARENQYGVVLMLHTLLVNFGRRDKVDATVYSSDVGVQVLWEIRNLFGMRDFPNCVLFICRGGWFKLPAQNNWACDLSSVLASFAPARVVINEPLTGSWSRNGLCFFFCFSMVVPWVWIG